MEAAAEMLEDNLWRYRLHTGIGLIAAAGFAAACAVVRAQNEAVRSGEGTVDCRMRRPPEAQCRRTHSCCDIERTGITSEQQVGFPEQCRKLQKTCFSGNRYGGAWQSLQDFIDVMLVLGRTAKDQLDFFRQLA